MKLRWMSGLDIIQCSRRIYSVTCAANKYLLLSGPLCQSFQHFHHQHPERQLFVLEQFTRSGTLLGLKAWPTQERGAGKKRRVRQQQTAWHSMLQKNWLTISCRANTFCCWDPCITRSFASVITFWNISFWIWDSSRNHSLKLQF